MNADGDTQNNDDEQHGNVQPGSDQHGSNPDVRGGSGDNATQQSSPATVPAGVLPNKAAEDDPRRWGDEPGGYDHDSWLQEQKPPHWG